MRLKKVARACPKLVFVSLILTLLFEFLIIYGLPGRIKFLYIYDNYSDDAEEVTAIINRYDYGSGPGYGLSLYYQYLDNDGHEYEGFYKKVEYLEIAQASVGTEIKIKIYDGRSWPSEMGRPNLTGEIIALIILTPLNIFLLTLLFLKIRYSKSFMEEKNEV